MRYLFGFICVLALGVMGCGQSLGPVGGSGGDGAAGVGGGEGGSGGTAMTDCTGAEDGTECVYQANTSGRCLSEVCFVDDCVEVVDGTNCLAYGDTGAVDYLGLCVGAPPAGSGGTCVAPQDDCTGEENGTPCWRDEGRSEMGMCDEVGVCLPLAAPEIAFVWWGWADDCDIDAAGQGLSVGIAAFDDDTPWEQLTYSGHVQDCTPDLNAMESSLSCEVYLGARQSEATVTDPQGNQGTMLFAPDPCTNGCVGSCPK